MKEKHGPCLDKKCSSCCNPVKVRAGFPLEKIPRDAAGEPLWEDTGEILAPETQIDTTRLKSYKCKKFDEKTGLCTIYENRPEICRNTSCAGGSAQERFIKIIPKK